MYAYSLPAPFTSPSSPLPTKTFVINVCSPYLLSILTATKEYPQCAGLVAKIVRSVVLVLVLVGFSVVDGFVCVCFCPYIVVLMFCPHPFCFRAEQRVHSVGGPLPADDAARRRVPLCVRRRRWHQHADRHSRVACELPGKY